MLTIDSEIPSFNSKNELSKILKTKPKRVKPINFPASPGSLYERAIKKWEEK